MSTTFPPRSIDTSLARSIRRGYFRRLTREWQAYGHRRARAAGRNVSLWEPVSTRRQFRDKLALLEKFVGPLLPACSLRIESGTRAAAVVWGLWPDEVPTAVQVESHARIRALVLLQPGRLLPLGVAVRVRAHAIDRVVQRARVVDLPIRDVDLQALNAEFADFMPLACVAARVLADHAAQAGDEAAQAVQVLLPTEHGIFLGERSAATKELEIRTFVDNARYREWVWTTFRADALDETGEHDQQAEVGAQEALDHGGEQLAEQRGAGLAPLVPRRDRAR